MKFLFSKSKKFFWFSYGFVNHFYYYKGWMISLGILGYWFEIYNAPRNKNYKG